MDNKKDMHGYHLVQNPTISSQKSQSKEPSKETDVFGTSLSKKCERLATAVYLITNFLPENEPLRPRLRSLSLAMLQSAGVVRYGTTMSERGVFEEIQGMIAEVLALLELAFIAGLISEMNFTILKREYASLRDTVEVKKVSRESSRTDNILGDTFFGTSFAESFHTQPSVGIQGLTLRTRAQAQGEALESPQEIHSIGHSKGQKNMIVSDRRVGTQGLVLNPKKGETLEPSMSRINFIQKETRRARILKLVKDNREVTIKDISNHFPGVSEKTVQREIVSLTESGIIKKTGERRWSRYTLA
jgi:DNA-binding transcriptional ArsR family regulator